MPDFWKAIVLATNTPWTLRQRRSAPERERLEPRGQVSRDIKSIQSRFGRVRDVAARRIDCRDADDRSRRHCHQRGAHKFRSGGLRDARRQRGAIHR